MKLNQGGEQVVTGQALVRAPTRKLVLPRTAMPTLHLFDPEARLRAWGHATRAGSPVPCAVVHPCDEGSLRGAIESAQRGLIDARLVGPVARMQALAGSLGLSLDGMTLVDVPHSHAAADAAVAMAARGEVAMLMKGSLRTDELMQAVIAEPRLRTGRRISPVFHFEGPAYAKPLLVTDAAINFPPTLGEKADIVRYAVELAHALGVAQPRVALLSAVETVTPRMRGRTLLAHLGNGASVCATRDGQSVATSMGFSALDGLMMGTRCGSLDPGVLLHLWRSGWDLPRVERLLYQESGLKGVSGLSADMRTLRASDCAEAREAVTLFTHRVRREVGAMLAVLGGLDLIGFTGGIGEHEATLRTEVVDALACLGARLDASSNAAATGDRPVPVHHADSAVEIWVMPTDEGRVAAQAAFALLADSQPVP